MDLRKSLFGSIVLSGGSTLTKGFGDRLLHEVQRLAVKDMRIKIFAPPERKYTTWTGGSILAGLSTFKKVSISSSQGNITRTNLLSDVGRQGRMAGKPRHNSHKVRIACSNNGALFTHNEQSATSSAHSTLPSLNPRLHNHVKESRTHNGSHFLNRSYQLHVPSHADRILRNACVRIIPSMLQAETFYHGTPYSGDLLRSACNPANH
jgi:hypothetical protein